MLLYGVLYPVGRILVETQRPDAWLVAGVPAAQWVAVGAIALSLGLVWYRRQRIQPDPAPEA